MFVKKHFFMVLMLITLKNMLPEALGVVARLVIDFVMMNFINFTQAPINVAGIASQYQKALSHVATALASQTAAEVCSLLIF